VLDVTGENPRLIREGAVSRAELEATLRPLNLRLGV
jgi:tRNA A37 threonylcarbamoyladenosine synthetase subunit TsaC/SUA5/YrdC